VLPVQRVTPVEKASNRAPNDEGLRFAMRRMIA
jgi:hypothetical protein